MLILLRGGELQTDCMCEDLLWLQCNGCGPTYYIDNGICFFKWPCTCSWWILWGKWKTLKCGNRSRVEKDFPDGTFLLKIKIYLSIYLSTEVRRKAASWCLVPYWLTLRPCSQKVTLSLWCESRILGSRTAVSVAITMHVCQWVWPDPNQD